MWHWFLLLTILHLSLSYFLWCFPNLLYPFKKRDEVVTRKKGRCISISHRGGAGEASENTMTAFFRAIENDTDMLEIDIRCTKDDQLVVVHDENLLRLCGVDLAVRDTNFNDLPKLLEFVPMEMDPNFMMESYSCAKQTSTIPLLATLLEDLPFHIPLHVDVCGTFCCKVSELLELRGDGRKFILGSTEFVLCSRCQTQSPYKFMGMRKVFTLTGLFVTGILPYIPIQETHYTIWLSSNVYRMSQSWGLNVWERRLLQLVAPLASSKMLLGYLQKRGLKVYIWVANSAIEFKECENLCADGIMTDYPSKLRNYWNKLK